MGPAPRGGAYTYDWIENLLGLDMHTADRVLAEFQHPEVGDTLRQAHQPQSLPPAYPGRALAMLPMEPGSLVMEHKMLRGIRLRAERLASDHT